MKKTFVISLISVLILFSSCKKNDKSSGKKANEKTEIIKEQQFYFDCKKQMINGVEFEACIQRPGNFFIKSSDGKIIYSDKDNPFDFEFSDFNGDGYSDIRMNYVSNTPGIKQLLLFDIQSNEFKEVKTFNKFPNSIRIEETNFYYSYYGSGCADNDWKSELYKLNGTEITVLGKIKGSGCLENDTTGIYIYKVNGNTEKLLNYTKREQSYWKEKYEFIKEYWTENKNQFE